MINKLSAAVNKLLHEETLAERSKRIIPGMIYCALAVTIYVLVSSTINVLIFKDMHLAVDLPGLLIRLVEYGIALVLAGAIVAWFTETIEGVVWGGVVLAILLLVGSAILSLISGRGNTLLGQSLITIIPVIAAGILVALVIRMAVKRHVEIRGLSQPGIRRRKYIELVSLVLVVGLVPGVFSLFGSSSQYAIRALNNTLQNYATDNKINVRFPYKNVPGLRAHFGMDYSLYPRISSVASGSLDITIHFKDGYAVTCVVPQMDSNEPILLDTCSEGTSYKAP